MLPPLSSYLTLSLATSTPLILLTAPPEPLRYHQYFHILSLISILSSIQNVFPLLSIYHIMIYEWGSWIQVLVLLNEVFLQSC